LSGGYIPLRSNERSNEEEAYFALSRWERYVEISHRMKPVADSEQRKGYWDLVLAYSERRRASLLRL
jgi:hypothetical protein